ncbi:hypothetical protein, partial [Shewanella sp.]|uniref:hypothetical protein n=1 Tax=Shewanella sp. TaxID=50422 RepID=UPI004048B7A2
DIIAKQLKSIGVGLFKLTIARIRSTDQIELIFNLLCIPSTELPAMRMLTLIKTCLVIACINLVNNTELGLALFDQ